MRKIPTLFVRDPADMRRVTREVHPDCQWVINGEGTATRKYDGTCVAFADDRWWTRREVKPGKTPPPNFLSVEVDDATGKEVGWEPVEQSAFAKWHAQAVAWQDSTGISAWTPGTYELVGPKIHGNPEGVEHHELWLHDLAAILPDVPRDFDGLAAWLPTFEGEGVVWHHEDGRMVKIKRKDFPAGIRTEALAREENR